MSFRQSVNSFLDHLRIERGLAANSIQAYERDLRKLVAYFEAESVATNSVTSADITAFESSLKANKLAPASINRVMSAVRTFYKYQNREHGIVDPLLKLHIINLPDVYLKHSQSLKLPLLSMPGFEKVM
jgi:integrase/recombinase XerD